MTRRRGETEPSSVEVPKSPARVLGTLAATALTACLAVGAVKGYEVYQDLQDPHYKIELDKIVGGTEQ